MLALFTALLLALPALAGDGVKSTPGYRLTAHPNGDGIQVIFELLDYQLTGTDEITHVELAGAGSRAANGAPDLPVVSTLLEVPAQAGISLELVAVSNKTLTGIFPAAVTDISEHAQPDGAIPQPAPVSPWLEPLPLAGLAAPAVLRDRRVVQLSLAPIQPLPQAGAVSVAERIEVFVSFRGDDFRNSGPISTRAATAGWQELYHNLILNYTTPARDEKPPYGEYVICYPEIARDELQPLIQWKREMGYSVDTLCTTPGNLDKQDILNYLQTRWDSGYPMDYLLLVGDKDYYADPIQMDAWFIDGGQYAEPQWNYQIVTDHPYSMLAGDDYLSDIMVGRLCVDSEGQLGTIVNKILTHERDINLPPEDPDWHSRALMICDWAGGWSRREVMRQICDRMLIDGFVEVDSAYSHSWNPLPISTVYNPVNDGVSFVNYRGFGMRSAWYTPYFTTYDIESTIFNYSKLPVVTSIVCGGGDFASTEADPCFGEKWLQHGSAQSPRGAIAFIGPSEEDTHTRWNNTIDLGIYQGVLQENLPRLGEILARGKLELYLGNPNFHNPGQPNNSVHFYFHTYNLLGDPGMILTPGTPVPLVVSHPAQIATELTEVAVNVSALGVPAEAYVTLYNAATDEAFSAWSAAAGMALVPVSFNGPATLQVTVSGYGWVPYRGQITVADGLAALQLQELLPVGEPELVVGEELSVYLSADNAGTVLSDPCTVTLTAEGCVFGASFDLPAISPGGSAFSTAPVTLTIEDPGLVLEEHQFFGELGDGSHLGFRQLVHGSALIVASTVFQDGGNQLPERSETAPLDIHFTSSGDYPFPTGTTITGTFPDGLSATPTGFTLDQDLAPGETLILTTSLTVAAECRYGERPVGFTAVREGFAYPAPCQLQVGELAWTEPGGPDAHGYRVYHSGDDLADFAQFTWFELAPGLGGPGQALSISDPRWPGSDDPWGETVRINLSPFNFRFYGQQYSSISICSNGWISPGSSNLTSFRNSQIPGANGPSGMIAALWDDLHNSGGGDIYIWHDVDNGRFYIEWYNFYQISDAQSQPVNFQVVLHDPAQYPTTTGDSEILCHYLNWRNTNSWENCATVGIENTDETVGLEYTFNNEFDQPNQSLTDGQSLWFTPGSEFSSPVVSIYLYDGQLNLYWQPVPGATSYRVYSSDNPYTGFTLDETGTFAGEFWYVDQPPGARHYRVTAVR